MPPDPDAVRRTALWLSTAAIWWVGAGLVSRATTPFVRSWTEFCFGAGLALTYLAFWAIVMTWSMASPRGVLVRALATTGTLAVLLALLELPATLGLLSYASLLEPTGITDAIVSDAELSFRRPPGQSWTGHVRGDVVSAWNLPIGTPRQISFTTDSRGFRNPNDRDQADVVLLGDSYVEGWYVSDNETSAALLEQRLGRPVTNLGVSGFGTLQQLRVLRRYALPMHPKLVAWFFFEGNDLYDDQEFENMLVYLEDHDIGALGSDPPSGFDWSRYRRASLLTNAYGLLRRVARPLVQMALPAHGWYRDQTGTPRRLFYFNYAALPFTAYEKERFDTTKGAFRDGVALARQQGVTVALFFVPMKFRVYGELCSFAADSPCRSWAPWDLSTRFEAFCAEAGIDCVDLSNSIRDAAAAGRLLYAPEDSHWNADGHAFVAEQVHALWDRLDVETR
jgi:hypothetical protein